MRRYVVGWVVVVLALTTSATRADLVALDVLRREPFAGGMTFGDIGRYDLITAVARFAVNPDDEPNHRIVDLPLAPRNAAGKVEFRADVVILAPADPARGNGALLYDVNNRGNKLALRFFNTPPGGPEPSAADPAGDGFLMRHGFTVVWSGWIGELLPGDGRLLMQAPQAREKGQLLRGEVRYETSTDRPAKSLPLSRRDGHGSYPPTKEGEARGVLTKRLRPDDPREVVPREKWRLARQPIPTVKQGVPGTLPQIRLEVDGGFEPGYLYELICEAEGSIVQGLGFAGVRDLVSHLRHDPKNKITRAHAFGVSQSGRFLRHFLYQGFNADERGRPVFDGLMPHVAGGGLGFFNHRFAQPTRHNAQHEEHLYPADVFPFTYGPSTDPFTKRTLGILDVYADKRRPKVMHTQSAAEYWHRSGSLVHMTPDGKADAAIPANARVYAFGGTQHGPAKDPPEHGIAQNLANPADYRPFLRALLLALDGWVKDGTEPPPSVYPKIADGTLVDWKQESTGFPRLPGVRYPGVIQRPPFADYGPAFRPCGVISREPPTVEGEYTVRVPKSDADGNDLGTLLVPDVAVPLATYTGWNLRRKEVGAEDMLVSLTGSYIPFPRTKAERESTGDPRLSILERYKSLPHYFKRHMERCESLETGRYLTHDDAVRLMRLRAKAVRPLFLTKDAQGGP